MKSTIIILIKPLRLIRNKIRKKLGYLLLVDTDVLIIVGTIN